MRERVVIPLAKPLRGHGGEKITQIVVREPTFDEYLVYGDPWTVALSKDGTPFSVDNVDVIRQYINFCVIEPQDTALLSQGGAFLGTKVKEAVLGFFQPEKPESEVSETSLTNSSSAASDATSPQSKG